MTPDRWLIVLGAIALTLVTTGLIFRSARKKMAAELEKRTREAIARLGVPAAATKVKDVNGVDLHVVMGGPEDGQLVVLLHGFPECWHAWQHQIPALIAAGYRVVVPDQRGYGLSDKPAGVRQYRFDVLAADVAALIEKMGREKAIVVGHDWGGATAWRFAIDYPEMLERLVILDVPHPFAFARAIKQVKPILRIWYMAFFQLPIVPEIFLGILPNITVRTFFRANAFQKKAFSDDDLALLAASHCQPGALTAMLAWYRAAVWYPTVRADRPIEAPVQVIWAKDDVALSPEMARGLEQWVPRQQLKIVPDCGHWVQNEQPEIVNETLLAFLKTPEEELPPAPEPAPVPSIGATDEELEAGTFKALGRILSATVKLLLFRDDIGKILASSFVLLLLWGFQGNVEILSVFFRGWTGPGSEDNPRRASLIPGIPWDQEWISFFVGVFLLVVVPCFLIRWMFGDRLSDYGLGLPPKGRRKLALLASIATLVLGLPGIYLGTKNPAMRAIYPLFRGFSSDGEFVLYELGYLSFFVVIEFAFRGYLLFGLARAVDTDGVTGKEKPHAFGRYAIFLSMLSYTAWHLGKPLPEAASTLAWGVVMGTVILATRSIWPIVVVHWLTNAFMDLVIWKGW